MECDKMMDWEQCYQINDTPWDKGYAAPPLEDYLKRYRINGQVLVPGCGLGHDVRLLASHGAKVTGMDIAPSAIERAKNFSEKENYVLSDFLNLPDVCKEAFDWVVEHTCFCAIHPSQREDYVKSAYEVLKPGGKLFGIFYLNPDAKEGPPFGVKIRELDVLFNFYFTLEEEWRPDHSYEGREDKELVRIYIKKLVD